MPLAAPPPIAELIVQELNDIATLFADAERVMEIGDNKSNSSINICLPRHIADELIKVLEPLDK